VRAGLAVVERFRRLEQAVEGPFPLVAKDLQVDAL
jgi:hypothetical protein